MNFTKFLTKSLRRGYYMTREKDINVHENPGLTAKRIIDCVGTRLRELDPLRWDTVPITFKTTFRDASGYIDLRTIINVHDALEREFMIEIKDKHLLVTDIETAYYVVTQHHDSY